MPTIGLHVNEEVWNAWRILNRADNKATKELKNALYQILEKHKDEIIRLKRAEEGKEDSMITIIDLLANTSNEEIVEELNV